MATAKQILGCIQFAAESARKHCPADERLRVDAFVCYLSGALKNQGAAGEAVSDVVFALFKDDPKPIDGA